MLKFLLSLLLLFCVSTQTFAQTKTKKKRRSKITKLKYKTKEKDSLAKIYRKFAKKNVIISKKTRMVKMTLKSKANKKIKNWRKLPPNTTILVYMDAKYINLEKVKEYKAANYPKKEEKKAVAETTGAPKKFGIFYMASQGNFTQDDSTLANLEFSQNSPLTLGFMYTYYPKKPEAKYSISNSAYFSYLVATSSNLEDSTVDVPIEIGLNSYYQYALPYGGGKMANVYTGLDFERFNTFNIEGVQNEQKLIFDQNMLGFLTVGYSHLFGSGKFRLLMKLSYSQSVFSSRTIGYADTEDTNAYSGNKILFFLSTKVYKDWFVSFLAKQHTLTGPSDVSSLRLGLGAGYSF